jgi:TctA family transporter
MLADRISLNIHDWHKTSSKKCIVQTYTQGIFSKRKEVTMVKKILQLTLAGLFIGILPLAAEQNKGPENIVLKGKEARDV